MNTQKIITPIFLGLVAVLLALGWLQSGPVAASPALAPTPVADTIGGSSDGRFFNFQTATALAADTNTGGVEVLPFDALDVQYVIDHGTANTTTLTVQYSNDNSNWVNGVALVSASAADGSDITRVPVFGRYMRVNQNVSTTDTITITLNAVGR